jgi:hypothetical protein
LRNTPKYHVHLSGPIVMPGGSNRFREVGGRGKERIDLLPRLGQMPDRTVKVSWHPTPDWSDQALTQRVQAP